MIDLKEIRNKITKKENFYFLTIIIFIFFIDRYSKIEIINNFSQNNFYMNEYVNLSLTWNTGIGFGLLSSDSTLLYNLTSSLIAFVIFVLFYFAIKAKKNEKFVFSLIIGGAIGNFYDRLIFNAVPDFIDLHFNNFHWFTFNVADIFITIGVIAFLIKGFFLKRN